MSFKPTYYVSYQNKIKVTQKFFSVVSMIKKMKFNLTFASVQAEREMEKNAKHREREREVV